ncbi:MAG: tRNA pseudouridine(13) synthase TruD [Aeromonadaceae bacterium]|jgi:tRNA pseudouridine13 synthase|nr:tRNA pseudouridine(13) synthase TruD [Aeromonadaceae bacterium]
MSLPEWNYLHGKPQHSARFKQQPEDFVVIEDMGFEPDGAGEHILVYVRKRSENTAWVAGLLAKAAGVQRSAVTWGGLKDRHAVTEQWFGIHVPGKDEPDLSSVESETIQILKRSRHSRKLRTGTLKGNNFRILLRDLAQSPELDARLAAIGEQGVPNYFGDQRFGRSGNNLEAAESMFQGKRIKDRDKRSLFLSAARSYLFNHLVSERLQAGLSRTLLAGDCLMLAGTHSFFSEPEVSEALTQRLQEGDLQLTAPLWGRGRAGSQGDALDFETGKLEAFASWKEGLEAAGLNQERRPLILKPVNWSWQWQEDGLELSFWLPAGCYATSIIRELVLVDQADGHEDSGQ